MLQLFPHTALLAVALATGAALSEASAATFTQNSGFAFGSCRTLRNTAPFATGNVLNGTHRIGGGCGGYFDVDLDTSARVITLTGREHGNYGFGQLAITGITEAVITGVTTVSYVPLFDPAFYGGFVGTAVPEPQVSFTSNSITVLFSAIGQSPDQFTYDGDRGQAVFTYSIAVPPPTVPEPASLAILGAGLLGLVGLRLRSGG
ncbi:PEP-CTERM sorting domain-containing protein [Falsiroseomonas oryzae]|uniref:PEP-CTERM sorting domain-containing protein n=1 Tax=Falsiroseomonas oryzae TaxID=2766473 RepID=UPI0022EA7DF0|nr:PEP-CTERM sorting domain-containing protein [Roseomonas sp. MO-31]